MVRVYEHFLLKNLEPGVYNSGFENETILNIAKKIQKKVDCKIKIKNSNDPRSYRLNSDKLLKTKFVPQYGIDHAIEELRALYNEKKLLNKKKYYNINWLKNKVV